VATKTVFIIQLLLGTQRECGTDKHRGNNRSNEASRNFHAIEEMLLENQTQ
jgi:hypothetical protein